MKKCPYCSSENDDQTNICQRCKAALPHESNKTEEPVKTKRKRSE